MWNQALMAAILKKHFYGDVLKDPGAILYILSMVTLSGIAIGLGLIGRSLLDNNPTLGLLDTFLALWAAVIVTLVGWLLWALVNYVLGSKLLGGRAGYRQILRALGICYLPMLMTVTIAIPDFGNVITVVAAVWVLIAGLVAIHEIQDVDWIGAGLSTVPGWVLSFLILPQALLAPLYV